MRTHRLSTPLICTLTLALLIPASVASASTLGRGLEQLTTLYETANPKLASAMRILGRIRRRGLVMVHVRLVTCIDVRGAGHRLGFVAWPACASRPSARWIRR